MMAVNETKPKRLLKSVNIEELNAAKRMLRLEAAAISMLANQLDKTFGDAIEILHQVTGRIIVTGMGKSGHIARKIAATLSSTGSPAQYVHPGEASHGDLGMITNKDAVIALSNSGETHELLDLLEYTRRFSIPLIAITGSSPSTLGDMSDIVLLLPDVPEGCPMGLAPTTSTTASLAMGDAVAVALLEINGFSANDFRVFHPGGKLGSSLLRVSDLMHHGQSMPIVKPSSLMSETILEMTAKNLGCVGIVDSGNLIGIVTDGDLRRHIDSDLRKVTAGEIMTGTPATIRSNALAGEAIAMMNEKSITNLFVFDEDEETLVGVLHIHDCLRAGLV